MSVRDESDSILGAESRIDLRGLDSEEVEVLGRVSDSVDSRRS